MCIASLIQNTRNFDQYFSRNITEQPLYIPQMNIYTLHARQIDYLKLLKGRVQYILVYIDTRLLLIISEGLIQVTDQRALFISSVFEPGMLLQRNTRARNCTTYVVLVQYCTVYYTTYLLRYCIYRYSLRVASNIQYANRSYVHTMYVSATYVYQIQNCSTRTNTYIYLQPARLGTTIQGFLQKLQGSKNTQTI